MRMLRFAGCAAIAAMWCATLPAIDLAEIEAKLAAQDAQLAEQNDVINDLKAKLESGRASEGDSPEALISIQKNARVTIGGQVNTKYTFTSGKQGDQSLNTHDARLGDLSISDAYLNVQIDVNDYFDAYLSLDLHNGADGEEYGIPEAYYIRWKNLCNTGFGIKIGRDALVFGADGVGELGSYAAGSGDGIFEMANALFGENLLPHNGWDVSGVTQITPYWEGLDGKLNFELSFMQNVYDDTAYSLGPVPGRTYHRSDGGTKYRSRNYGVGTFSTRLAFTPIEDLTLTASLANYHSNGYPDDELGSIGSALTGTPGPSPYANVYDMGIFRKN
ncbi:MAG: hypothetical protein LBE84_00080, partial [Planctomycetota bacterium]|nr:hypothetical protein [Planctomycetota bacterium]